MVDGKGPWLEVCSSSDHSGVPLFCLNLREVDFRPGFGGVDGNFHSGEWVSVPAISDGHPFYCTKTLHNCLNYEIVIIVILRVEYCHVLMSVSVNFG